MFVLFLDQSVFVLFIKHYVYVFELIISKIYKVTLSLA
jgi:hypothetical protein